MVLKMMLYPPRSSSRRCIRLVVANSRSAQRTAAWAFDAATLVGHWALHCWFLCLLQQAKDVPDVRSRREDGFSRRLTGVHPLPVETRQDLPSKGYWGAPHIPSAGNSRCRGISESCIVGPRSVPLRIECLPGTIRGFAR